MGDEAPRRQNRLFLLTFGGAVLVWPLLIWPAFAILFRGGISYWFSGIALVTHDGCPAGRGRCGLREILIWLPFTACLLASLLIQVEAPALVTLRSWIWLAGVALLPIAFLAALRDPTRSLADRLVGVYLVPR